MAYISLLAVLVVLGSATQIEIESIGRRDILDCVSALLLLLFLASGWRIFIWVIAGRAGERPKINNAWLISAALGVVASFVGWVVFNSASREAGDYPWYRSIEMFMPGVYFMPTAIHLAVHLGLEYIANKKMQPTQKARG